MDENLPEDYDEPDILCEYLFIEDGYDQDADPKDEGTFYGNLELFFDENFKKKDLKTFIKLFNHEFILRAKELVYFENKSINLEHYKFGIIDENENITEFEAMDAQFFKALMETPKFFIVGKEFDLQKFKDHQIFSQFYKFIYVSDEELEDSILDNYIKADATVEYFFVEKADVQKSAINDDQGYIMGFINLFFTGDFKNDDPASFKNIMEDELNYSIHDSKYFKNKKVDFKDYKFVLIDNEKNITEFGEIDNLFYETLKNSLRNLLIVGKNFDVEKFKHHEIFNEWFDNYSNTN